jgi:DHA1 family inner membrane transport protein
MEPVPMPGRQSGWAVLALAVGGFGIGTGEFVMMALLPSVAGNYGISIPTAGHVISAYALGVVVGAPLIAIGAARWPRHRLLLALMACFVVGNLASALAPGHGALIAIRFLAGLPHGAYFGVASLVAASLVPPSERAWAVGRMMLGLTGATLAGVPLATWIGQSLSWRAAYVLVAAIGFAAGVLIYFCVPRTPPVAGASPARELSALGRYQVWLTLAVGSVGFGGMFCVYSYITPTLTEVSGLSVRYVPYVLAVFGGGMIVGNLIGSWLADRALMRTIGGLLIWNAVVLGLFSITGMAPAETPPAERSGLSRARSKRPRRQSFSDCRAAHLANVPSLTASTRCGHSADASDERDAPRRFGRRSPDSGQSPYWDDRCCVAP